MARDYALPGKSTLEEPPAKRSSRHYRKMREPFAAELNDPATRRLLRGIISAENPGAKSAVVESLMNRTAMVNERRAEQGKPPLTLKDMIKGHPEIGGGLSFYGPMRTGAINQHLAQVDSNPAYAAQLNSYIDSALGGADTISGHTDQGSKGDPNYIAGGTGVNINGERFNDWGFGGSRAWRERQQVASNASAEDAPLDPTPNVGSGASAYPAPATDADTAVAAVESKDKADERVKKKDYGDIVGSTLEDVGKNMAAAASKGSTGVTPANVPMVPQTPLGISPVQDPKVAEMQRQQLAMAMQRLNAGRLF